MENKMIKIRKPMESWQIADIVFHASKYRSRVYLRTENQHFNIKSLMGMFVLKLEPDMEVQLETEGEDEHEAMLEMVEIFG